MNFARAIVQRISRNRILRRRLPAREGAGFLYVSPDAALSFWKPTLSSDLFDFADQFCKPGGIAWDVGSNVGLFAFAAAAHVGDKGSVLALEPDLFLMDLMRRSSASQPALSAIVECLPLAVSDSLGIVEFHIAKQGRASNSLSTAGRDTAGGSREKVQVMTVTLDWLLTQRPPPNVVKIDVEGAELAVLRGAEKLLNEVRPTLLCEVGDPARADVTRILRDCGYELHDWDHRASGVIQTAAWNTLAIPL